MNSTSNPVTQLGLTLLMLAAPLFASACHVHDDPAPTCTSGATTPGPPLRRDLDDAHWNNPVLGRWELLEIRHDNSQTPSPLQATQMSVILEFKDSTVSLIQGQAGGRNAAMTRPYSLKRGQDGEVIVRMTDLNDTPVGDESTLRLVGDQLLWMTQPSFALVFKRIG